MLDDVSTWAVVKTVFFIALGIVGAVILIPVTIFCAICGSISHYLEDRE